MYRPQHALEPATIEPGYFDDDRDTTSRLADLLLEDPAEIYVLTDQIDDLADQIQLGLAIKNSMQRDPNLNALMYQMALRESRKRLKIEAEVYQ